jgi:hypothetical protein
MPALAHQKPDECALLPSKRSSGYLDGFMLLLRCDMMGELSCGRAKPAQPPDAAFPTMVLCPLVM